MGGDLTDLVAWQQAAILAAEVLDVAEGLKGLSAKNAGDQMVRAAESIAANIAEGYGRGRNADGVRFMRIARSSAVELESHLRQAVLSRRTDIETVRPVLERTRRVRALINGLIKTHGG